MKWVVHILRVLLVYSFMLYMQVLYFYILYIKMGHHALDIFCLYLLQAIWDLLLLEVFNIFALPYHFCHTIIVILIYYR